MTYGRRAFLGGLAASAGSLALPRMTQAAPLANVKELGVLRVGLYSGNRPWSYEEGGKVLGIDADIARAVADSFGVKTDLALFPADEEVSDDLRNVVWRGGLLGFRKCDVMFHVPFDRDFAAKEDQVVILAPYYRESFGAACSSGLPECEGTPTEFRGRRLAAELDSIPDFYLIGSFGGILRPDVTHYTTGFEAVAAIKDGRADLAVATDAQIESALAKAPGGDAKRRKGPLPAMLSPGWDVGIAVDEKSRSLGFAIEEEMDAMMASGRMAEIFSAHGVTWRPANAVQV
ncbi:substrate-binding periplasmic protein [Croceicoccus naphthovorans]|uniref:ABC transporter substrate-binding protein n=1 Tax=Croceicoccus naphthovorans TaxID=1348774 RepID=A0A0G3XJC9_9SPHN|nr:transporter substrate-binding domain-containing protein [Croceicoccus naphthovorans]AKM10709.1 ABC transporter substrate-binding protein [Croceicoccus naphthovorans]MBB3991834.1 ABC-type amino acid transport substrate-binding protein [Croceicoccus naphthovorans]